LAEEAGLSQSALSNMYSRETLPSLGTLFNICDALGISPSDFFREDTSGENTTEEEALLNNYRRLSKESKTLLSELAKKLI